jgi:hypothetical protein
MDYKLEHEKLTDENHILHHNLSVIHKMIDFQEIHELNPIKNLNLLTAIRELTRQYDAKPPTKNP